MKDQMDSPTYMVDLVALFYDVVVTDKYGIFYATNEGICSWAEFAKEVFLQVGMPIKVKPIPAI